MSCRIKLWALIEVTWSITRREQFSVDQTIQWAQTLFVFMEMYTFFATHYEAQ